MAQLTVVFADLTGSTRVFEALGNAKATQAITKLTYWISSVCEAHSGHGIKFLGDGVLILFRESRDAVEAVVELQQIHQKRILSWPEPLKMALQIGIARGDIVEQDSDYYGDAVNVASRLSDLSGPEQILVSDTVMQQLPDSTLVRSRCMGALSLRGRVEQCVVHRIEWQAEIMSEVFTVPAVLSPHVVAKKAPTPSLITLSWLDVNADFEANHLPLYLGRGEGATFVVQDPRVSRQHARIEVRDGRFYIEDTSSYGTWVRFSEGGGIIALRREECVLLQAGEIALGATFDDFSVPTVSFSFH